ncbi:hypothetical protein ASD55_11715 [Rhodanobacter sp. Root561]|uniref:inovirus-type Gp2 protein n=1 Tax=Rhodanobacter sp. Root561 TaxID=1736560 RepID=UPI0006F511A1|nr:inovirus-type Gp2 protein [Rhodanobacter sp. Root561]KQZ72416.1 hypothetical protein ASD55_11715 [Rhodanobacter sp. Root561]
MKSAKDEIRHDYAALEYNLRQCSFGMLHLAGGRRRIVTDNLTAFGHLAWLEELAIRIATKDEKTTEAKRIGGCEVSFLTALGKEIFDVSNNLDDKFYKSCEKYAFNPYITVIIRAFFRTQKALDAPVPTGFAAISPCERSVAMEWIVHFVRRVCRSKRFKAIIRNHDRRGHKDFQSGCRHLAHCFANHSRILIVRVDLFYRPEDKEWSFTPEADRAYSRFTRALSEGRIVPDVITWAGRRENGFDRGVHYHVLVAMDGHKHQKAFAYAVAMGKYWRKRCTGPNQVGTYFNCYPRKGAYRFNGLGSVHISDERMLIGVREAMRYITKAYYQAKAGGDVTKNFRRGLAKNRASKRGAPRKAEHDMSLVMRILGSV